MPESPDLLEERLRDAISPGARHRLLARGLARGMIWADGALPPDAPQFSPDLSSDLLDQGYGILARALRLRELNPNSAVLDDAFRVASEAIESTVRHGDLTDSDRGFRLLVAAIASHLGGYAARAYSLIGQDVATLNLSSDERLISLIARRSLTQMRSHCVAWLGTEEHQDPGIVQRLADLTSDFELDDALEITLRRNVHRSVGLLDSALVRGDATSFEGALQRLATGREVAAEGGFVSAWWVHVLLQHLSDDLWNNSLWTRLPIGGPDGVNERWTSLRRDFIQLLNQRDTAELTLWPSQLEAAARAVDPADDLVVALPTSAGKTRIAELCILRALADERRVVYITPLRALSAQQERTLSRTFRPLGARVTSLYGSSGVARADVATLQTATIVVATPEKLDFALRHQPSLLDDVGLVVLDEGHMIGIDEREVRYEALVQRLLSRADAESRRLVCLSAIFGSGELTADFTSWIRSDSPGSPIESQWRPTRHRPATLIWDGNRGRLEVEVEGETPFVPNFVGTTPAIPPRRNSFPHDHVELVLATADGLMSQGANVLVYCTQRNFVESVTSKLLDLVRRGFLPQYQVAGSVRRAQRIGEEWLGSLHPAVEALSAGVAMHHGGLPRAFLDELEEMLASRTLRYAIASPTVAQGLDLSASALVFHSLHRSGQPIQEEEYKNVIGRVGRAFVDLDGISVLPVDLRAATGRRKRALYRSLVRGGTQRSLESGIALLIDQLISTAGTAQTLSRSEAVEYLLGQQSVWSASHDEPTQDFAELIANLDSAILSTVEDLDTPVEELADVIDAALRNSLWRRTLQRMSPEVQDQQRRVLLGRATWIWHRTTGAVRRGFFASGVGFAAGAAIDRDIETLARLVDAADTAIAAAELAEAAGHLVRIEEMLEGVAPFDAKSRPEEWRSLLSDWISGDSIVRADLDASDFVQDGLVYRLVWAVEAIPAHAEAVGVGEPGVSGGHATMALTYGVPTLAAATILRHGLPSRRLAMEIARRFPPPEVENVDSDLSEWMDSLLEIQPSDLFADPLDASLWQEFFSTTSTRARRWFRTTTEVDVTWMSEVPSEGAEMRVVRDGGVTHVCGDDLTPLGVSGVSVSHAVRALVRADGRLDVERFGPAS